MATAVPCRRRLRASTTLAGAEGGPPPLPPPPPLLLASPLLLEDLCRESAPAMVMRRARAAASRKCSAASRPCPLRRSSARERGIGYVAGRYAEERRGGVEKNRFFLRCRLTGDRRTRGTVYVFIVCSSYKCLITTPFNDKLQLLSLRRTVGQGIRLSALGRFFVGGAKTGEHAVKFTVKNAGKAEAAAPCPTGSSYQAPSTNTQTRCSATPHPGKGSSCLNASVECSQQKSYAGRCMRLLPLPACRADGDDKTLQRPNGVQEAFISMHLTPALSCCAPLPFASGSGQEAMAAPASASSNRARASSLLDEPAASELLRSEHAPSNCPCCSLGARATGKKGARGAIGSAKENRNVGVSAPGALESQVVSASSLLSR